MEERLNQQKIKHKGEEEELLQKVTYMENQITEVKSMYQRRMYEIEAPFNTSDPTTHPNPFEQEIPDSSKIAPGTINHLTDSAMYPILPAYSSIPFLTSKDS